MLKKIGALWQKESKSGKVYYSGEMEAEALEKAIASCEKNNKGVYTIRIIMFENNPEQSSRQPEFTLHVQEPEPEPEPEQPPQTQRQKNQKKGW